MTISRRKVLAASSALLLSSFKPTVAAVLNEDGMYSEPWFLNTMLELSDDLGDAASNGKRFAILWELRGCPYCKEMHLVNLADAKVASYIEANFSILQLNIIGSRIVTDFDGAKLSEKQFAQKYNVRFTPTIQFFPEIAADLSSKDPGRREVARMPGYVKGEHFLAMFRFVRDKAYERENFRSYVNNQAR
ncbi:SoxW family protein [Bradyrhizobium sp. HKCCYLS2038]|uniref:SoxW family protein n=1 Tax=unclassified Bradyrhizobium TaxID=2631580 RepID=UPI003EB72C3D